MSPSLLRFLTVLLTAIAAAAAHAQNDRVRTTSGTEVGEVTGMTALEVTVKRGSTSKEIPVSEIESVQFGEEPSELTQARVNARNGGYQTALEKLSAINKRDAANPFIEQELAFYKAYCQTKLVLLGEGDFRAAGRELNAFIQANTQNYHFLQATQLLGDLLVSEGMYGPAEARYTLLAKAPWPSYKARAGVLIGETLQAQDKHAEAIEKFDAALAAADDTPEGKTQKLAAQLGKGVSLAATGKVDEGVKLVQGVLRAADPEQEGLLAAAYNALGSCYVQAKKEKAALFAFLHVDLLFASIPEQHAEALFHLASLWDAVGKPQEGRQARAELQEQYASSTWAKRL